MAMKSSLTLNLQGMVQGLVDIQNDNLLRNLEGLVAGYE